MSNGHCTVFRLQYIIASVQPISTKFGMATQYGHIERSAVKFEKFKIQHGRDRHLAKWKSRHISASFPAISTKFGTATQFRHPERSDRGYLPGLRSEVQKICIWFSWCHWHPIISCFIEIQNSLPFWCRLTQVVMKKRPFSRSITVIVVSQKCNDVLNS